MKILPQCIVNRWKTQFLVGYKYEKEYTSPSAHSNGQTLSIQIIILEKLLRIIQHFAYCSTIILIFD